MRVYIKDMEMPKNCLECSLSDVDDDYGRCCLFSGIACLNIGRQNNCPLVEIPPHGRLIDADALLSDDEIMQILTSNPQRTGKLIKEFAEMFVDKVNRQPTIIEAEGNEE